MNPPRPADFREVSDAAMDSAIAQCERRLAAGDDRHAALAELYNWGWIHEWQSNNDFWLRTTRSIIEDGQRLSAEVDAAMEKICKLTRETK